MSMRRFAALIAAIVAARLLRPAPTSAWGEQGHRLVAQLAALRLTPVARRNVAWLLGSQDMIRFVPTSGTFTGPVTVSVHGWDGTSGSSGTAVNLSKSTSMGGATAFSTAALTGTLYVNNAPTLSPPARLHKSARISRGVCMVSSLIVGGRITSASAGSQ